MIIIITWTEKHSEKCFWPISKALLLQHSPGMTRTEGKKPENMSHRTPTELSTYMTELTGSMWSGSVQDRESVVLIRISLEQCDVSLRENVPKNCAGSIRYYALRILHQLSHSLKCLSSMGSSSRRAVGLQHSQKCWGEKIKLHICIKVFIKSPNENFYSEKLFRFYQNFCKGCSPTALIQEPLLLPTNPSDDTAVSNENHRPLTDTKKNSQHKIVIMSYNCTKFSPHFIYHLIQDHYFASQQSFATSQWLPQLLNTQWSTTA